MISYSFNVSDHKDDVEAAKCADESKAESENNPPHLKDNFDNNKDNSSFKNEHEKTSMSEITSQRRKETEDNYHTRSTEKDKTTYQEQRWENCCKFFFQDIESFWLRNHL